MVHNGINLWFCPTSDFEDSASVVTNLVLTISSCWKFDTPNIKWHIPDYYKLQLQLVHLHVYHRVGIVQEKELD